jgi:hypothetical protein
MNYARMLTLAGIMACPASLPAATLLVEGYWEGSAFEPFFRGETQDYYKFEVITSGTVRMEVPRLYGGVYLLAAYIGVDNEFGFIGNPFRIERNLPCEELICTEPRILERFLPAGQYVVAATAGGQTSYDIFDGYVAVNREALGLFGQAPYAYTITGDVRGLEYWDGHIDGTFTVTQIPEPSSAAALLSATVCLLGRRRP